MCKCLLDMGAESEARDAVRHQTPALLDGDAFRERSKEMHLGGGSSRRDIWRVMRTAFRFVKGLVFIDRMDSWILIV